MIYSKSELCGIVADVATSEGVDPAFVMSIVDALSGWNPALVEHSLDPEQYNPILSRHGSPEARLGLLQISSGAARELGYKESQAQLLAPTLNVQIGCRLLKKALEQTGKNADRALLVCYGYSVASLIPKIQSKCGPYKEFLLSRPRHASATTNNNPQ